MIIASCSSDGSLKVWDTRLPLPPSSTAASPSSPHTPALATAQVTIPAHIGSEILDLDCPNRVATVAFGTT
jgi:peroxin-7